MTTLKKLEAVAPVQAQKRKQSASFTLDENDNLLVDRIAHELRGTRSDAVRRCIRVVAKDLGLTKE